MSIDNEQAAAPFEYVWVREVWQGRIAYINGYVRISVLDDIKTQLRHLGRRCEHDFAESSLGHFLRWGIDKESCKAFLHVLMSREVRGQDIPPDERCFLIGRDHQPCRFSKIEFALITGLKFGDSEFDPSGDHCPPEGSVFYRVHARTSRVTVAELRTRFQTSEFLDSASDTFKIAKILIVYCILLGVDAGKSVVDMWVWDLIEQDELWESFPWGKISYLTLLRYMDKLPTTMPQRSGVPAYHFYGFSTALMIWAFEVIPMAASFAGFRLDTSLYMPRCLKWSTMRSVVDVTHVLDGEGIQCFERLIPTPEELIQPYFRDIDQNIFAGVQLVRQRRGRSAQVTDTDAVGPSTRPNTRAAKRTTASVPAGRSRISRPRLIDEQPVDGRTEAEPHFETIGGDTYKGHQTTFSYDTIRDSLVAQRCPTPDYTFDEVRDHAPADHGQSSAGGDDLFSRLTCWMGSRLDQLSDRIETQYSELRSSNERAHVELTQHVHDVVREESQRLELLMSDIIREEIWSYHHPHESYHNRYNDQEHRETQWQRPAFDPAAWTPWPETVQTPQFVYTPADRVFPSSMSSPSVVPIDFGTGPNVSIPTEADPKSDYDTLESEDHFYDPPTSEEPSHAVDIPSTDGHMCVVRQREPSAVVHSPFISARIDFKGSNRLNPDGQESPSLRDRMHNGIHDQLAKTVVTISEKLQDDLQELGLKIKPHEDNINFLKSQKTKVEESILDMQIVVGKHQTTSFSTTIIGDTTHADTEEETIQQILKYEKSAAALLLKMKTEAQVSDHLFSKDVVGVVATLGKVDDANLSRLLSEYLGLETMLAVVCKSYDGVSNLEAYTNDGLINKDLGIHAFAASIGWPLHDRFHVICLEDLRPYPGKLVADDPQRRLDLLKPRLVNGQTPPGFLGFAVNMILIDQGNLDSVSNTGHSLRETLFYNLFSNLQVYKSREDMLNARSFITSGAISLDGGVMRSRAVFSLGHCGGDIKVKFPSDFQRFSLSDYYCQIENRLKEAQWKRDRILEDIQHEQEQLDHVMFKYEAKKREFVHFLAETSPYATQNQVGRASTPR